MSEPAPSTGEAPNLRDPATPLALDVDARLPATWSLAVLLVLTHVATALGWSASHPRPWWMSLLFDRPRVMRVWVGGQSARRLDDGEWWRLATSTLLHADAVHLTLNVLGLVALGRLIEPLVGGWRFLAWFVLGGLGGSVASWAAGVRFSDGASGGAYALLGAIAVIGWVERGRTDPLDRRLFGPVLQAFLVGNVVLSFVVPVIDAVGHLGGLAVGLVLGLVPGRRPWPVGPDVALVVGFVAVCAAGWWAG